MKAASNPLAYVLWVIVSGALVFGVVMTAIKTAALFTQ